MDKEAQILREGTHWSKLCAAILAKKPHKAYEHFKDALQCREDYVKQKFPKMRLIFKADDFPEVDETENDEEKDGR